MRASSSTKASSPTPTAICKLIVDLGVWWKELTGLPLPLGCERHPQGSGRSKRSTKCSSCCYASIKYGLDHRGEALDYALQYGRDLDRAKADRLSACTSTTGRSTSVTQAAKRWHGSLAMGYEQGVLPTRVVPEFVRYSVSTDGENPTLTAVAAISTITRTNSANSLMAP